MTQARTRHVTSSLNIPEAVLHARQFYTESEKHFSCGFAPSNRTPPLFCYICGRCFSRKAYDKYLQHLMERQHSMLAKQSPILQIPFVCNPSESNDNNQWVERECVRRLRQQFIIPSTGAIVTMDSAVGLLSSMCQLSLNPVRNTGGERKRVRQQDARPDYRSSVKMQGKKKYFITRVAVPRALAQRVYVEDDQLSQGLDNDRVFLKDVDAVKMMAPSIQQSQQLAAMQAIWILHDRGVIDDNLLLVNPFTDDFGATDSHAHVNATTSDSSTDDSALIEPLLPVSKWEAEFNAFVKQFRKFNLFLLAESQINVRRAFTHKSATFNAISGASSSSTSTSKGSHGNDYEALEVLGDAVLKYLTTVAV